MGESVLVLVSIVVIIHYNQRQLGKESIRLFPLTPYTPTRRELRAGTEGRNLEAGTDAEAIKECYLLSCPLRLSQLDFLYIPGPHIQEWQQPQWAGPSPINHQSIKHLTDMPTGQSEVDIFSIEFLGSQITLACVPLTKLTSTVSLNV